MSFQKTKINSDLGKEIHEHLVSIGMETPVDSEKLSADAKDKIAIIEKHTRAIWETLGMDLTDDSLMDTPNRIAKMMVLEHYWGLLPENFPKNTTIENKMNADEMITVSDISVMSNCEHHGVIFHGVAHISYIPNDKVIGLSKLNRIVEYFCRRPQVQERLTSQIYHTLSYILGTENVAVAIEAQHFCVVSRGVEDANSKTFTTKLGGAFKVDPATRSEFLQLVSK
jgi:GTP cyclohydrolase I